MTRVRLFLCFAVTMIGLDAVFAADETLPTNKKFGLIFNNDSDSLTGTMASRKEWTPEIYRQYVERLLDLKPGLVAQDVGFPEGVLYPTKVDTNRTKYWDELCKMHKLDGMMPENEVLRRLLEAGTDPLTIMIQACRKRGVPVLASYRMNAEDCFRQDMYKISDFGRAHPECRIPVAGVLDPSFPVVFEHRMKIFAEVAADYDIDGIEFDFRRWFHMVSDPLKNHTVLTRMVRDTRKMLDDTARRKGRQRMILGVRVGPMLEGKFVKADFPGSYDEEPMNQSCQNLGLDVKTWVKDGLVDYICPALFAPVGLPRTKEFVDLAEGSGIGIYPSISFRPLWTDEKDVYDSDVTRRRHRDGICNEALKCYADGADGVSTFNWFPYLYYVQGTDTAGPAAEEVPYGESSGYTWVQTITTPKLSNPEALRELLKAP